MARGGGESSPWYLKNRLKEEALSIWCKNLEEAIWMVQLKHLGETMSEGQQVHLLKPRPLHPPQPPHLETRPESDKGSSSRLPAKVNHICNNWKTREKYHSLFPRMGPSFSLLHKDTLLLAHKLLSLSYNNLNANAVSKMYMWATHLAAVEWLFSWSCDCRLSGSQKSGPMDRRLCMQGERMFNLWKKFKGLTIEFNYF